jgi:hypothetical protein
MTDKTDSRPLVGGRPVVSGERVGGGEWVSGVPRFQLLQWKYAVGLESKGMRHSSGRSVRKHAALALGLPPRSPAALVIAAINEQLQELPRAEDEDPTPWCAGCGARRPRDCHCGPLAGNE